jgi:hypothetical protein
VPRVLTPLASALVVEAVETRKLVVVVGLGDLSLLAGGPFLVEDVTELNFLFLLDLRLYWLQFRLLPSLLPLLLLLRLELSLLLLLLLCFQFGVLLGFLFLVGLRLLLRAELGSLDLLGLWWSSDFRNLILLFECTCGQVLDFLDLELLFATGNGLLVLRERF